VTHLHHPTFEKAVVEAVVEQGDEVPPAITTSEPSTTIEPPSAPHPAGLTGGHRTSSTQEFAHVASELLSGNSHRI
jgi:hypothetical protein